MLLWLWACCCHLCQLSPGAGGAVFPPARPCASSPCLQQRWDWGHRVSPRRGGLPLYPDPVQRPGFCLSCCATCSSSPPVASSVTPVHGSGWGFFGLNAQERAGLGWGGRGFGGPGGGSSAGLGRPLPAGAAHCGPLERPCPRGLGGAAGSLFYWFDFIFYSLWQKKCSFREEFAFCFVFRDIAGALQVTGSHFDQPDVTWSPLAASCYLNKQKKKQTDTNGSYRIGWQFHHIPGLFFHLTKV